MPAQGLLVFSMKLAFLLEVMPFLSLDLSYRDINSADLLIG